MTIKTVRIGVVFKHDDPNAILVLQLIAVANDFEMLARFANAMSVHDSGDASAREIARAVRLQDVDIAPPGRVQSHPPARFSPTHRSLAATGPGAAGARRGSASSAESQAAAEACCAFPQQVRWAS